jgi:subtilisin-like proprotein convertase family protein
MKKTGELGFIYSGGQFTIQPVITTDQWTHVALTYNAANSTTIFYVNGDSVAGTFSTAGNLASGPADSLFIGGLPHANVPVIGQLDEVRIWKNIVRTRQQIKENMHKNINYKSNPAPSPADFMVFSFDGRTDDTGNDALTNAASTLKFYWAAHIYAGKRNTYSLTSPILRDDQGDFMGATYSKSKRRFFIPDDGGVTSAFDSVYFGSPGTVSNLKMYIMLSTASSNHLDITLTAPNGTSVQLTPNASNGDAAGFNGSNDLMTIFDQSADTTITYAYNNNLAPYSPKIKPYQSLAVFNGMNRQGWWKIKITDMYPWDQAFLHGWGIQTSILTSNDPVTQTPYEYSLRQNYPNPFNPSTTINYELKVTNHVKLNVYDITGKLVSTLVNNIQQAGRHAVTFNASHLSSGVYFYKLETEGFTDTKRMLLVK